VRRAAWAAIAIAIGGGAIAARCARGGGGGDDVAIAGAPARSSIDPRAPVAPRRARVRPPSLPRSLEETEVDGAFPLDGDGHLRATAALRRRFDYFLTAEGEESLAVIRSRIVALAADELAPAEADAALALFDRYCAYRDEGAALIAAVPPPDDPVGAIDRLRRDRFGAAATAFFAED